MSRNQNKDILKRLSIWIKQLYSIFIDPKVILLPGQIAFFLILSIFPFLILTAYITTIFGSSATSVIDIISIVLPTDIASAVVVVASGKSFDSSVILSMIIGFIIASNGAHSIILASNTLYGFPNNDFIKRRLKALFIIFILVIIFIMAMFLLAYGNVISRNIFKLLKLQGFMSKVYNIFVIAKWPIVGLILFFSIKMIYVVAPDWRILSKNTTKGALFTTIGWVVASAIFSYYVSHFSNYDILYGSLSSIVILMIWIYILCYIFVIGIAINVKEYRDKEEC